MSTYDWTNIGTEVVPQQHRSAFLSHLRGEITTQPESGAPIEWTEPRGMFPEDTALAIRAAVEQYEISPVLAFGLNLTWTCDQNTRKPGPGDDAEALAIIGIKTDTEAMYFIRRGYAVTPIVIETL